MGGLLACHFPQVIFSPYYLSILYVILVYFPGSPCVVPSLCYILDKQFLSREVACCLSCLIVVIVAFRYRANVAFVPATKVESCCHSTKMPAYCWRADFIGAALACCVLVNDLLFELCNENELVDYVDVGRSSHASLCVFV